ncbi:MAG: helix-turn-helix domain-containing protein [Dehalococcoidia bacterium]|nr:MAG: helix-turn-helix domain-containing protein [Dehalococcoidia bacterium]
MRQKPLLGISEASNLLGVSEATLRQWTDEGSIKAFVTPGGHRRYSKEELKEFVTSHENLLGLKDLVGELEKTAETHREIGAAFLHSTVWYERISAEHKRRLAVLGRQILDLMMSYAAGTQKRTEALAQAREIGRGFGDMLAAEGVPLTDSVQAFISHRDPITDIVTEMMRKKELVGEGVLAAMPLIEQIMDWALVSLVEAHQRHGAGV